MFSVYAKNKMNWNYVGLCGRVGVSLGKVTMLLISVQLTFAFEQWFASGPRNTGWRTKCHTIDCARNTFLLLQKHLTSDTELILIDWKIVPNEEHVQCDHRFASQPLANEPLHSSQLFDSNLQKARGTTSLCGP